MLTLCVPSFAVIVAQPSPLPVILKFVVVYVCGTESGTVTIEVLLLDRRQDGRVRVMEPDGAVRSGVERVRVFVRDPFDRPGYGSTWSGTFIVNDVD